MFFVPVEDPSVITTYDRFNKSLAAAGGGFDKAAKPLKRPTPAKLSNDIRHCGVDAVS
jgi:hypothetical protein